MIECSHKLVNSMKISDCRFFTNCQELTARVCHWLEQVTQSLQWHIMFCYVNMTISMRLCGKISTGGIILGEGCIYSQDEPQLCYHNYSVEWNWQMAVRKLENCLWKLQQLYSQQPLWPSMQLLELQTSVP